MTEMERMLKESLLALKGDRREAAPAGNMAFRPADPHGGSGTPDSGLAPGGPSATGGAADIDAALAQRLSAVQESLLPALTRLNSALNGK